MESQRIIKNHTKKDYTRLIKIFKNTTLQDIGVSKQVVIHLTYGHTVFMYIQL